MHRAGLTTRPTASEHVADNFARVHQRGTDRVEIHAAIVSRPDIQTAEQSDKMRRTSASNLSGVLEHVDVNAATHANNIAAPTIHELKRVNIKRGEGVSLSDGIDSDREAEPVDTDQARRHALQLLQRDLDLSGHDDRLFLSQSHRTTPTGAPATVVPPVLPRGGTQPAPPRPVSPEARRSASPQAARPSPAQTQRPSTPLHSRVLRWVTHSGPIAV